MPCRLFNCINHTKTNIMSEKKIEQPSVEYQKMLDAVLAAEPLDVEFRGKRRTIGWLHKGTIMKFSHIVAREENENRRNAKICAVVLLNNIWKIRAFYGIYWRWLYYFCDLDDVEVLRLLETAKKKTQSIASSLLTILVIGMTNLRMTMTTKEVDAIQAEQAGDPPIR